MFQVEHHNSNFLYAGLIAFVQCLAKNFLRTLYIKIEQMKRTQQHLLEYNVAGTWMKNPE